MSNETTTPPSWFHWAPYEQAATARQSAGTPRIPSSKPADASAGTGRRRRGTVLSTHNATHYAANTFDADEEGTVLSTHNATPSRPTRPTVPMAQPMQAQPTQSAPTQQPLPQSQSAPVMATRQFPQTTAPSVKPAQPAMASSMMSAPQADITEFHELFAQLVGNVSQVVVGKEQPIRQCATAMIVGGHILLEDNPGTGKTQLARGLANSIDMSFKRIQFTPDLLPSDVVGVTYYDQKNGEIRIPRRSDFRIHRARRRNQPSLAKKTQSALLEVMEEQKVTVDGETHAVPQPFMVDRHPRTPSSNSAPTNCLRRRWTVSSSKQPSAIRAMT